MRNQQKQNSLLATGVPVLVVGLLVFGVLTVLSGHAWSASNVQGVFQTDEYSGYSSNKAQLKQRTVWLSPLGGVNNNVGVGMNAAEIDGVYNLAMHSGSLAGGSYYLYHFFMRNSGLPFVFETINVPAGDQTYHYNFDAPYDYVCWNDEFFNWGSDPNIYGAEIHQTFVAASKHITGTVVHLLQRADNCHYLGFQLHQVEGTNTDNWPAVSPIRTTHIAPWDNYTLSTKGGHRFTATWFSSETYLTPGVLYALRVFGCDSFGAQAAPYEDRVVVLSARPNSAPGGDGPSGHCYKDGTITDDLGPYGIPPVDLAAYIGGDLGNNTVLTYGPRYNFADKQEGLPWSGLWGQTFRATGEGMAAISHIALGMDVGHQVEFSIRANDIMGTQIGPAKSSQAIFITPWERAMSVAWAPGEVPLTPGEMYCVRIDAGSGGTGILMNDAYHEGGAVLSQGTPFPNDALMMSIQEWDNLSGDPSRTPTPSLTPTSTPTPAGMGENLLVNGGAEQSTTSIAPWTQAQNHAGDIEVNKTVWGPDPLEGANGTNNWFGVARQSSGNEDTTIMYQTVNVTAGTEYVFQAYFVTGANYNEGARAQVRGWVVNGAYPGGLPAGAPDLDTTNFTEYRQWTLFTRSPNFVPHGSQATVVIAYTTSGTQWQIAGCHADEIVLAPVGDQYPTPTSPPATPSSTPTAMVEPTATPTQPECTFHTADQTGNWQLDFNLSLLLIQRFNSGGEYSCGDAADGYQIGPGPQDCPPHDTDYNQNWMLDFQEMLRFIQFFNMGYHCSDDPASPDGYAPGPAPR